MIKNNPSARGVSLMEMVVCMGILATLIGILVPAIQQVRGVSVRAQCNNQLRQVVLALHQGNSSTHSDGRGVRLFYNEDGQGISPHVVALWYLEQVEKTSPPKPIKQLLCPIDRTLNLVPDKGSQFVSTSYAANFQVFKQSGNWTANLSDGLSNTLGFAEHYSYCGTYQYDLYATQEIALSPTHLASFAGPMIAYPVTSSTGVTLGSEPDPTRTFQMNPAQEECSPEYAQTPHIGGMPVALMDGSVRVLSPKIRPEVYWGSTTPAGNETLGEW